MSLKKGLDNGLSPCQSDPAMARSEISRTLRDDAAVARIAAMLSQERFDSRSAFGRRVCEEFSFISATGRMQLAGCMKALAELADKAPGIVLPAPAAPAVRNGPRLLDGDVAPPVGVPSRPAAIRDLELVQVTARSQRETWNTLIAREHPHGITTFAGCQVRYLVGSAHGWLGAAGFSAAALRVAARDRWMAWDDAQRRRHLDRVVCLSRYLIRPSVACPHLASHVLGRLLRRLPRDFEARYGFRPWLVESFADEGYKGTCLRAANFLSLGRTAGRGRQDRKKRREKTVKTVFMYTLDGRWRRKLGVPWVDHAPALQPGEGLNAAEWAANEFGDAPLGDKRLSARLVKSAGLLAAHPGRKINANSDADSTAIAAFYRMIEAPAESEVTAPNILAPHRERTVRRMRGQKTVLAIQDGTDLNFATRPGCDGLQVIGRNQTKAKSLGLHMHATLAVTETGLPLGVLRLGFDPQAKLSKEEERRRKTVRWLEGFDDTADAVREVGGKTRVIAVCDREGDMFELFDAQRRRPRVGLLVRAKHDRVLGKGRPKLFATMSGGAPDGMVDVEIEGLAARPKSSRRKARPARAKRLASCELRFRRVTLPATGAVPGAEPVSLHGVHVREVAPPEGEDPVQWFLLTTVAVGSAEDAAEIVGHYLQRWKVEDYFRVLKSGCRTEFLLFRTAERLQRAVAINAVIAWRIMVMTLLGRQVPDCDPDLMFTDHELDFLRDYALEHDLQPPARLGDAVRLVAHLGGYRDRKHDPEPGNQIMWHGQTRLTSASIGHRIGFRAGQRHALRQSE
ncbi:MAG: IS4 family transposase [Gemmatimonadetes bacterium]|nr:IS4 family transposase [Gemmatimonadota bacterium]